MEIILLLRSMKNFLLLFSALFLRSVSFGEIGKESSTFFSNSAWNYIQTHAVRSYVILKTKDTLVQSTCYIMESISCSFVLIQKFCLMHFTKLFSKKCLTKRHFIARALEQSNTQTRIQTLKVTLSYLGALRISGHQNVSTKCTRHKEKII